MMSLSIWHKKIFTNPKDADDVSKILVFKTGPPTENFHMYIACVAFSIYGSYMRVHVRCLATHVFVSAVCSHMPVLT